MSVLLVAAGGALGAALRFLLGHFLDSRLAWGTLVANVAASFALGWLLGHGYEGHSLTFLGTGLCGGLSTYSAFAVQTVESGLRRGAAYTLVTLGACLSAAAVGLVL